MSFSKKIESGLSEVNKGQKEVKDSFSHKYSFYLKFLFDGSLRASKMLASNFSFVIVSVVFFTS